MPKKDIHVSITLNDNYSSCTLSNIQRIKMIYALCSYSKGLTWNLID